MKKYVYGILAILVVAIVAEATSSPFPPWLQTYINQPANKNGRDVRRTARAQYDYATHGGTVGSHGLGVTLPANSIITGVRYHIDTTFVDAVSSNAMWFFCEDLYNSVSDPTDLANGVIGSGHNLKGHPLADAPSSWVDAIANQCEITFAIASAAITAGKATVWVDYINHD